MQTIDVLNARERLVLSLRALYEGCGYVRFPMRRFEEYAFYLENKSFLTSESVLSFTNANGRLMALKPDVTLSIVKRAHAGSEGVEKLYYHESVYRVAATDHEFTEIEQIGVELLGDIDLYGTGEVLRLAIESLRGTGLAYVLDVSHMGFAGGLMAAAGLEGERREAAFRLVRHKNAHELRAMLLAWQVAPFYAERIAALPTLAGSVPETLKRAADLAVGSEMTQAIGDLSKLYGVLEALGLQACVRLDFSILNDLDYYSGLVFQGYASGAPRAVLSGGRYDPLMRKLGKQGGGLGFALYLDELKHALAVPCEYDADVLALYCAQDSAAAVLAAAETLRASGLRVLTATRAPQGLRARKIMRFTGAGFDSL
ncbi:MAG: ATP phosphoribosyltransferase regulatory subunit [Clostridia bacterium]